MVEALVTVPLAMVPLVDQNVGSVAKVVEALVIVPLVMAPLFIQAFPETVRLVVEALFKLNWLFKALMVPEIVKLLKEVSPVTVRVPPIVALPVKPVLPETESELRVAPDLTVNVPLITASLAKFKYVALNLSKPD